MVGKTREKAPDAGSSKQKKDVCKKYTEKGVTAELTPFSRQALPERYYVASRVSHITDWRAY